MDWKRLLLELICRAAVIAWEGTKVCAIWIDHNRVAAFVAGALVLGIFDVMLIDWAMQSWVDFCGRAWIAPCRTIFAATFVVGTTFTATLALRRFSFFA